MNTLESAFDDWFNAREFNVDGIHFSMADMREAFDAGYIAGFDHAKKEALSTLAKSLDPRPTT